MNKEFKYRWFLPAPDSSHNLVASLVPAGARVLEFGCATGYMSAELKRRLGCTVTGVELAPEAAELAREHCERVVVGDAELLDFPSLFGGQKFDAVIFADVLEHLKNPGTVLARVRPFLAEGGAVIASIPNIAHGSVRLALLQGEFRYREYGLLDNTHLQFFTRTTIQELFERAGYRIVSWLRRSVAIDASEVKADGRPVPDNVLQWLAEDPELASYQYVVRAETAETIAGEPCGESAALETAASDHDRRLAELTARCTDAERARREAESGAAELRAQLSAAQTQLAASNPIGPALTAALEARDLLVTQRQMRCLKRSIRGLLPRGAKVLVVSKGDDELLDLDECAASHFPQAGDGTYAGHYPGDSAEAIAHLEALREAGAEYLLFPPTARWWLEHYRPLAEHLHARYEAIVDMDAAGLLFALSPDPQRANPTV